jgi:hypothetical protein
MSFSLGYSAGFFLRAVFFGLAGAALAFAVFAAIRLARSAARRFRFARSQVCCFFAIAGSLAAGKVHEIRGSMDRLVTDGQCVSEEHLPWTWRPLRQASVLDCSVRTGFDFGFNVGFDFENRS